MQTITINTYSFNELSDTAKKKAIDEFRYMFVEDTSWYDHIIEDANNVNLDLRVIDYDFPQCNSYIDIKKGKHIEDIISAILHNHGCECETFKIAQRFSERLQVINTLHGEHKNDDRYTDERWGLLPELLQYLEREYTTMLANEYNHLISDYYIEETLESMDYQFNKDGKFVEPLLREFENDCK